MPDQQEKVLRVGILQDGRIIEERLLRQRAKVTIGQSPSSNFYLPMASLPHKLTLFDVRSGAYRLRLPEKPAGRVFVDGEVVALQGLPRAARTLTLTEDARGRIELDGCSVLFQMVVPPRQLPKPCLPASARGGLSTIVREEAQVLFTVLASFVLHGGFIGASMLFESPPQDLERRALRAISHNSYQVEMLPERADMKVEPEEPQIAAKEKPEDENPEETSTVSDKPQPAPQPAPARTADAKRDKRPVNKPKLTQPAGRPLRVKPRNLATDATIIKFLNGFGKNGKGGVVINANRITQDQAFGKGIRVAQNDADGRRFRGGPKREAMEEPEVAVRDPSKHTRLKPARVRPQPDKQETKVRLRARTRRPTGKAPQRTLIRVGRAFRERQSAFRACYESRLRLVPNLSGKVVISVVQSSSGKVGAVRVESNSTGDSGVASCIKAKVSKWTIRGADDSPLTRFKIPIMLTKDG